MEGSIVRRGAVMALFAKYVKHVFLKGENRLKHRKRKIFIDYLFYVQKSLNLELN